MSAAEAVVAAVTVVPPAAARLRSARSILRCDGIAFMRGSNASRRPSPMKLTHSAMTMMKSPAHQNSHGRVENALWYSLMSCPSEICGGRIQIGRAHV